MLPKSAFSCLNLALNLGCFFKTTPFIWDGGNRRLELDPRGITKIVFSVTTGYLCFHSFFVTIRCVQSILAAEVSPAELLLEAGFLMQEILGVLIQLNTFLGRNEMVEFFNESLNFESTLTRNFQREEPWTVCGIIIWSFVPIMTVHYIGCVCLFLIKPRIPIFYFSLLDISDSWKYYFILLETFAVFYTWVNSLPYITGALMFVMSTTFWLKQLSIDTSDKNHARISKTHSSIRKTETTAIVYRSYQLLIHIFNDYLNVVVMKAQMSLVMVLSILSIFGSIRFYHTLNLVAYGSFPALAVGTIIFSNVTYRYGGIINGAAEEFRRSWLRVQAPGFGAYRSVLPSEYLVKFLRSCRDPKIKMGNFYYFGKTTATTFTSRVIEYAVNLLVAV